MMMMMMINVQRRTMNSGQKMSRCCPTFSGFWQPSFCGAQVRPNMLNMPKPASVHATTVVLSTALA